MPLPRSLPPAPALRAVVAMAAALVVLLLVEVVGLRSGTAGVVLVGFAALLALGVLLTRVDVFVSGIYSTCAAAFTLSWNGWYLGPLRPGDLFVFLALFCFVAANPNRALRTPPWWIKQLVVAITIVVVAQIFLPPLASYLNQRTVITADGVLTSSTDKSLTLVNLGVGLKFIVAIAIVPIVFAAAVRADRRAVRWLPVAFAIGCAVSGWVAFADRFGTSFSALLTGLPNPGGTRQIGFSDHPNFLAPALVLAFPFAYWMLLGSSARLRVAGALCMPGLLGGVYASGSRGGAVAIVLVALLSVALHPRSRIYFGNILTGLLAVAGIALVAFPSVLDAVLVATRLNDPASTSGSDQVRALVGAQAVQDFLHSPVIGIGLQVSDEAQQVYLQELASGGLLLFLAMSAYTLGATAAAFRLMRFDSIGGAVVAALVATVALNFAEANLTDRYYYVPAALLVAMLEHRRLGEEDRPATELRTPDDVETMSELR